MNDSRLAFTTPTGTGPLTRWLVFSPLARIALFAVLMVAASIAVYRVEPGPAGDASRALTLSSATFILVAQLLPAMVAYLVLVHFVERRRARELRMRDAAGPGLVGLAAGAALFSLVVAVLWLAGSYHVTGFNSRPDWLPQLLAAGIGAGVGEEIVSRGVLFRIVEEGLGTWAALIVSALFFGGMHFANPAATWWSCAAIAVEGGLLLAMLYHLTRSLWPCIGLHAGWNIAQGTIYGIPVSGNYTAGWLVSNRTGPPWLSGGAFGAEASVVALVACAAVSIGLIAVAVRRHSIVEPAWIRRRRARQPGPGGGR